MVGRPSRPDRRCNAEQERERDHDERRDDRQDERVRDACPRSRPRSGRRSVRVAGGRVARDHRSGGHRATRRTAARGPVEPHLLPQLGDLFRRRATCRARRLPRHPAILPSRGRRASRRRAASRCPRESAMATNAEHGIGDAAAGRRSAGRARWSLIRRRPSDGPALNDGRASLVEPGAPGSSIRRGRERARLDALHVLREAIDDVDVRPDDVAALVCTGSAGLRARASSRSSRSARPGGLPDQRVVRRLAPVRLVPRGVREERRAGYHAPSGSGAQKSCEKSSFV